MATSSLKYGYGKVLSVWKYQGVVKRAILALKFKFATEVASELTNHLAFAIKTKYPFLGEAVLVPVPLHSQRERWRGFNQSSLMGSLLAKNLNWEYRDDVVVRTRATKTQSEMRRIERGDNVKECFEVIKDLKKVEKTCVVFDDVLTTGSTMREVAQALERAGVKKLAGLTIAR